MIYDDNDEPLHPVLFVRNTLLVFCAVACVALYFTQCGCGPGFTGETRITIIEAGADVGAAPDAAPALDEVSLFADAGDAPDVNAPEASSVQDNDAMTLPETSAPICSAACPSCVLGTTCCRTDQRCGCAIQFEACQ